MESRIEIGMLFDFYGPLLTKHQREIMALWCEDDLSLSEIAGEQGISRQAVSDCLHNAQDRLEAYEQKLGLLARYRRLTDGLRHALELLQEDTADSRSRVQTEIELLLSEEEK